MLTTRHGEKLRSRPMVLVQDEYDGVPWFYTNLESEKVFELESDNDSVASSDIINYSAEGATRLNIPVGSAYKEPG